MAKSSKESTLVNLVLTGCFALALTVSPLALNQDYQWTVSKAEAKGGNGGGNGGGNAGGNGGGKGNDKSAGASSGAPGKNGNAYGHTRDEVTKTKNTLGSLNAANASATARANASPNSRVGKLAEYERELAEGDLEAAAEALAGAANKGITPDAVKAVNEKMGIETDFTDEEIAEAAAAKQDQPADGFEETADTGENGSGAADEDEDAIAAAAQDLIDGSSNEDGSTATQ